VVGPAFEVEHRPSPWQGAEQGGLPALTHAEDGDAGKGPEVLIEEGGNGTFHTLQNQITCLILQAASS
jgi:hypothetical protein